MAMKYIKLFESWRLMEGEDDIDVFEPNAPKKFPVLQTTSQDFRDCSSKQREKLFISILQRACQKDDGAFNIKAGENIKVEFLGDFGYYDNYEYKYKPGKNDFLKEFNFKDGDALADFMRKSPIYSETWDKQSRKAVKDGINVRSYVKISDGSGLDYYFLYEGLNAASADDPTKSVLHCVINSPIYIKSGSDKIPDLVEKVSQTTIGQWATFANQGMTEDNINLISKSNFERFEGKCNKIFGGEDLTSAGKFAKTVKIGNQDLKLANGEDGTIIPLYVATDVMGTCGFDFNKATLKEDAKETLSKKELWAILTNAKTSIEIIGHTDSVGKEEVNMDLSKQRAESVLKFLQGMKDEYKKITQKKIKVTTTGLGFKEMIVDDKGGKDKDAAAKNRRVVIKVDGVGPDYKALGLKK